jgi:hypothetical protein
MRKTLFTAFMVLVMGSPLAAQTVDVSVHGGYTSFSMQDINHSNAMLIGWNLVPGNTDIKDGMIIGADFTHALGAFSLGLRTEYLQSNLAELKNDASAMGIGLVMTDQASLSNALLGGSYRAPWVAEGLTLGLGAWLGCGYGVINQDKAYCQSGWTDKIQSGAFSSTLLVAELEATVSYALGARTAFSLSGGWRWADAPQVTSDGEALSNGVELMKKGVKAPVNADFGGATAQGSVSYSF